MHPLTHIGLMAGSLAIATCTTGQDEWILQRFTSNEGLPQNSVVDMAMDGDGYLWISTEGGLARSDGRHVERVSVPAVDGLVIERMREIIVLADGRLVMRDYRDRQYLVDHGLLTELPRSHGDRDLTYRLLGALPTFDVFAFAVDDHSALFSTEPHGLEEIGAFDLGDGRWAIADGHHLDIYEDTLRRHRWTFPYPVTRQLLLNDHVLALLADGTAWCLDPASGRTWPMATTGLGDQRSKARVNAVFWESGHVPCCTVGDSLFALRSSPDADSLFAERIEVTLPSHTRLSAVHYRPDQGLLLIGTHTMGLFVYRRAIMRSLLCNSDYVASHSYTVQLAFDSSHVLSVMEGVGQIFSAEGCTPAPWPVNDFQAFGLVRDRHGRIWYNWWNELHRFDQATGHDSLLMYTPTDSENIHMIYAFHERGDSMWISLGNGIGVMVNDRLRMVHSPRNRAWSTVVHTMRDGPDGSLWVANCNGAFRLDVQSGELQPLPGAADKCARSIERIGDHFLMGTYGQGAYVWHHGRMMPLPLDRDRYLQHAHTFMLDSLGSIWTSTNNGMLRFLLSDLEAYLADSTRSMYYAFYGKTAGIRNPEFNGGCDPAYVRLANGYASFPSMEGLVWFKPDEIPDPFPRANIEIRIGDINGPLLPSDTTLDLPDGQADLELFIALPYWGDPANVQLEYRLSSVTSRWTPLAQNEHTLRFQRLPWGEHVLEVRKISAEVRGDHTAKRIHLRVGRPFYLQWWFILLVALVLLGSTYLAIRLNEVRLRRKNLELAQRVRARTRQLEEANQRLLRSIDTKDRLVSIITHDIVTPLRYIARVARVARRSDPQKERTDLEGSLRDISITSETLFGNARNLLSWIKHQEGRVELRERHVALFPLVEEIFGPLRELAASSGVELVNAVPLDDVVMTDRDILGIILQNLVTNSLNHAGASRVSITGSALATGYRMEVRDNGPGIPAITLEHIDRLLRNHPGKGSARTGQGQEPLGLGLVIVVELAQVLRARVKVESREGQGACVSIELPGQKEI